QAWDQNPPIYWLFTEVRTIKPLSQAGNPAGNKFQADSWLQTYLAGWAETRFNEDPKTIADRDRDKLGRTPLSVSVAVTEGTPGKEEPRMLVFGSASWVSNARVSEGVRYGELNFELFRSCLQWMRGRPDIGKTADPKEMKTFSLSPTPE